MLTIRIDRALDERLQSVARRLGRTKIATAREAIAAKIDHLEELAAMEAALHEVFEEGGERLDRVKLALGFQAALEKKR